MRDLLRGLLVGPAPAASPEDPVALARRATTLPGSPVAQAVAAGFAADRVGAAFAAGYQAALRRLVPALPPGTLCSLCVSEEGGAHPRALRARLADGLVTGRKQWSTLAPVADSLLVVAVTGEANGRPVLAVGLLPARGPGVGITAMPETPFTPEVPHGLVELTSAPLAQLLPGDGYERYVKPFRTIEDLHVHAAILAHVLGVARRSGFPRTLQEKLVAALVAAAALAVEDPDAPELHLAVAGLLGTSRALLAEAAPCWPLAGPEVAARFLRDAPLLEIAERARMKRTERAWARLAGGAAALDRTA